MHKPKTVTIALTAAFAFMLAATAFQTPFPNDNTDPPHHATTPSITAIDQLAPIEEVTAAAQILQPDQYTPTAEFMSLPNHITSVELPAWHPNWGFAGVEPTYVRAPFSLYRGPAAAKSVNALKEVNFIELDLEVMPERFLYPLEVLAEGERYYLACQIRPETTQPFYVHVQFTPTTHPSEIGGLYVEGMNSTETSATIYGNELRFVVDDTTVQLQATADADTINASNESHNILWFAFSTEATDDTASLHSETREIHTQALNLEIQIAAVPSAVWDVYDVDLTDYLYPSDQIRQPEAICPTVQFIGPKG